MKMEADLNRFHKIIRGKIKKELKKYISNGELIGRQGKKSISIPLPQIDLPKFTFGESQKSKVGQGEGEAGQDVKPGQEGSGAGAAGKDSAEHDLEVDISLQDLASILGEELGLPNIKEKGKKNIQEKDVKYTSILKQGPESLAHFRRTYKEALKRSIAAQDYNPNNPIVVPIKDDKRYRSMKFTHQPLANALIIYMMDVSGSMGDEQKEIVRLTSFWLDTWISSHYKDIDKRYIIHDATAKEVNQDTFYRTKESGGTLISSAYRLANSLIESHYPPDLWNIYLFHFSDGDNWSGNDTTECLQILDRKLLPASNLFCYGQVESRYGSGQFLRDLKKHFNEEDERVSLSQIKDREAIIGALKHFLGKGR